MPEVSVNPLNREILRLALPSILANLTVPLVGMVDIAVAGHLDFSAAALIGGVSIGSLMFDVLYWNFGFLRAGTGGLTSQAFGRKDWTDCVRTLVLGITTALSISLILILLSKPFCHLFFAFVSCSEEVRTLAVKYFSIRILCCPATLSLMVARGWFIGMQDTFSSMVTDTVVNLSNMLFSLVLAMGIPSLGFRGMGFEGVAAGTLAAQYLGLLVAVLIMVSKYSGTFSGRLSRPALDGTFSGKSIRNFISVNKDLFIRSLCLIAVYLGYSAISA
ncbi:MAG: MATE family efflux transporter, partial [Candidatus Cryptobacteroides sp.]